MTAFSILICTCNPSPETLEQVLISCTFQNFDPAGFEIILIDNNSAPSLSTLAFLRDHFSSGKIKLIEEKKQGLAYARISGSRNAAGKTLVFVDDDNIIDADYLRNLSRLQDDFPQVAAWGPGKVDISYKGSVAEWVKKDYAWLFQQKNREKTQFGIVAGWPEYYPAGSGLAVSKDIMSVYTGHFETGHLTLTGRQGKMLSSAEDTQIVWTAIKLGKAAGTSPLLKLTHVIPRSRTTLEYLRGLNYGIAHSYAKALHEMFPEKTSTLKKRSWAGKINFTLRILLKARFNPLAFYRFYSIENSWYRAIEAGQHLTST